MKRILGITFIALSGMLHAAELEMIHGYEQTEKSLTFIVTSTGCTKKEDFEVVTDKLSFPVVTLVRKVPDLCEASPRAYSVQFSLNEIGTKSFKVGNPSKAAPLF